MHFEEEQAIRKLIYQNDIIMGKIDELKLQIADIAASLKEWQDAITVPAITTPEV